MPPEIKQEEQSTQSERFNFLETDPNKNFAPWFIGFCAILIVIGLGTAGYFKYQAYKNHENGMRAVLYKESATTEQQLLAQGIILPPDPGEAGKQTLEGIDSDGDGMRDDVQRWIALTHKDKSQSFVDALKQFVQARLKTSIIDSPLSRTEAMIINNQEAAAMWCLGSTMRDEFSDFEVILGLETLLQQVDEVIFNTTPRREAEARVNEALSGAALSIEDPEDWSTFCE